MEKSRQFFKSIFTIIATQDQKVVASGCLANKNF